MKAPLAALAFIESKFGQRVIYYGPSEPGAFAASNLLSITEMADGSQKS
jgi:hypothetical protein